MMVQNHKDTGIYRQNVKPYDGGEVFKNDFQQPQDSQVQLQLDNNAPFWSPDLPLSSTFPGHLLTISVAQIEAA